MPTIFRGKSSSYSSCSHPLLDIGLLSVHSCCNSICCYFFSSSVHRLGGLPTLRLSVLGLYTKSYMIHLPSAILAMVLAHLHFCLVIRCIISSTPVCRRISSFLIWCLKVRSSIDLSNQPFVILNFLRSLTVMFLHRRT